MTDDHRKSAPAPLLAEALHEDQFREQVDLKLLTRLVPYVRPHLWLLGITLALMPVSAVASLLQPYLIKLAIDATLLERSMKALMEVVTLFGVVILCEFIARFIQIYAMQLAGQRAVGDLRMSTFGHIQKLPIRYFDHTPVGRVVTRVTNDVDTLSEFFASGAIMAIADVLMLLGIVAFMLYLDWQLSLVAFLALPPLALAVAVFRRSLRDAYREIRARVAQLNAYLNEQVQGIAVVQAFGRERACAEEYDQINDAYRRANYRSIRFDALLYSVVESVAAAAVAVVVYYASMKAGLVSEEGAAAAYVGTVVAFYEYIQRFFVPIRDLSSKYTIVQSSLASAERIFGLLDEPTMEDGEGGEGSEPADEEAPFLEIDHVTFAYREGHPVLHDVSLSLARGEKVALVGATGAGKTTITALALRLYEVTEGRVRVAGRDVQEWSREALRNQFAVIPQDVFLFRGSVLTNIALGDETPDRTRVRDALDRVGALDLVERRGGLDADVGERGGNFSAGERQLLAFARALYQDAPALILDEATAHVDSETEARLQAAVLELLAGRTSIVIAHRLSTIRHVDRIVVFHHGAVVESGSHAELLARDGVYARLHKLQFASTSAV